MNAISTNRVNEIELKYKKKFYSFYNLLCTFSFLVVGLFTIITSHNYSSTVYFILIIPILLLIANYTMEKSVRVSESVYILTFFFLFPVRLYFSGGVEAPGLMCALIGFYLFSYFDRIYIQLLFFGVMIGCLSFFQLNGVPQFEHTAQVRTITCVFVFIFMFLQYFYRYFLNLKMRNELISIEKNSTEGALIATICHEINNPLSILLMAVHQLRDDVGESKAMGMIERSCERLSMTLNKIKDIQSGKYERVEYSEGVEMYDIHKKED